MFICRLCKELCINVTVCYLKKFIIININNSTSIDKLTNLYQTALRTAHSYKYWIFIGRRALKNGHLSCSKILF